MKRVRAEVLVLMLYVHSVSTQIKPKLKLTPYSIPENRALKQALGYQEDTYLNFTELTSKYKYTTQEHEVVTEDGYILTIFRILSKCDQVKQHPVLLLHGIFDSADLWIIAGREKGLAYILSNNCFDVWVANHRGNHYSRRHVRLDPDTDPEYWEYSFDEHGTYDLPAMIDYVLAASQRPRLYYIGHSQGTTNFFVMSSLRPEYNDKIRLSIQLAPIAFMGNITSPILSIAAHGLEPIKSFLEAAGYRELFAKDHIAHFLVEFLCQIAPDLVCGQGLALTTGYKIGSIYSRALSRSFGHSLDGISVKDLAHFGQLVLSGKFQRYDEGSEGNIKRYGTSKPPQYDLSKITSPVVLMAARSDWISTLKDTETLRSQLPNVIEKYIIREKYWSHNNHLWGETAPIYEFPKILDYFNRFHNYNSPSSIIPHN
ncbi:Lipase [Operophtera brumata]|uniref:Lipase n=1 Tax=Operophtera brumata TaxID=104452 RepID=A0A0L7KXY5_OPEBR|nr:Lipase [Operophtera brumata]